MRLAQSSAVAVLATNNGWARAVETPGQAYDDVRELLSRLKAGEHAAFATLYELYFPRIYSYLYYHLNGAQHDVDDLTNDVFMKVLEKIHTFEFRGVAFSAWLYRIAHNHLIDHLRSRPRQRAVSIDDCSGLHSESAQRALENMLTAEDLKAALVHLTAEQRQVIVLRFVQGLSTSEIAETMRKSEDAVKKLQGRGLQMLQKVLSHGRARRGAAGARERTSHTPVVVRYA